MSEVKAPPQDPVKSRAAAVMGFKVHLTVYLAVNLLLLIINLMLLRKAAPGGQSLPVGASLWCVYPIIGWGLGLFMHYVGVFHLSGPAFEAWKEQKTREFAAQSQK